MFKNDRMMTMLTGLVLAIFAGTMVQYGDRFMAMISGENQFQTSDDFYSVRSGSLQILDVLANDDITGPIVVVSQPQCGTVSLRGAQQLQFSSDSSCSGKIEFAYCVDQADGCVSNTVTLNVISLAAAQPAIEIAEAVVSDPQTPEADILVEEPQDDTSVIASENAADSNPGEIAPDGPGLDTNGTDEDDQAISEPVVVASLPLTMAEEPAPAFNDIVISLQPPALVAPTVDEFVTPSVATASIRQQNIVLENSNKNTDTGIAIQSSTETVAPVEFGVASFGSPLETETSDIMIGGADTAAPQVMASISPQLNSVAPQIGSPLTQLERGPFVLAELPQATNTSFGRFLADDQNASQFVALLGTDAFEAPTSVSANVIAKVETGQTDLIVETSGTTALIALQLTDAPLEESDINTNSEQEPALPSEQNFNAQQPAPITLLASNSGDASPTVLGREPIAETIAPQFANTTTWALTNSNQTDVLLASAFGSVVSASVDSLSAENTPAQPFAVQPILETGTMMVLASQLNNLDPSAAINIELLTLARLGNSANTSQRALDLIPIGPQYDITGILPLVDTNVPAPLAIVPETNTEDDTQLASLDTTMFTKPIDIIPVPQFSSACEIFLDPSVRSGANILLFLIAECKPNMPVTISHAGLEFTILTGPDGTANIVVPALQRTAEITATFADGSSESTVALVTQINDVTRAAVTWRGDADLDLHAFEYGAVQGSDGHVWSGAARDYRSARLKGGGYLVELGDKSIEGGALAEVYTMPLGRSVQRGSISMTLEINNGDAVCGTDISARTLRTRADNDAGSRRIRFTVPNCGDGTMAKFSVPGAVDDIRLAAQ